MFAKAPSTIEPAPSDEDVENLIESLDVATIASVATASLDQVAGDWSRFTGVKTIVDDASLATEDGIARMTAGLILFSPDGPVLATVRVSAATVSGRPRLISIDYPNGIDPRLADVRAAPRTDCFEKTEDGIKVAPGEYAVVASDWSGDIPDPRGIDGLHGIDLSCDDPTIQTVAGVQVVVLPMGVDAAGCKGRSLAIGGSSLVCFGHLVVVPVEAFERRSYPYAAHIDLTAPLTTREGGLIGQVDEFYTLDGFKEETSIDPDAEGAFSIDGEFFDMSQTDIAAAFGYGTDEFNQKLDEHGFPLDVAALRASLKARGRSDLTATMLLSKLPSCDFTIAYYAPVAG